jgi:hypothetical protein
VKDIWRWYFTQDGKKIAVVETRLVTPKSCPCLLAWNGVVLEHPWQRHAGWVDALAWTADSSSLIVQEPSAAGTMLIRIDPKTGRSQNIASNRILLGVSPP